MNTAKTNRLSLWFRSLRRSGELALIIIILASAAVVAYAASILFNSAHSTTSLSKDRYIEVEISGGETSGGIRPGGTVSLVPPLLTTVISLVAVSSEPQFPL